MPAPTSEAVKQRALALLAQSHKPTINSKCVEVFNKLLQEGHPVRVRTLHRWASATPISFGPANSRANRNRHVVDVDENINAVDHCLNQHQKQISIREIAKEVNISKSSVHKILKNQGLHAYKCIEVQALSNQAKATRVQFYNTILSKIEEDPNYHHRIIFTDETSVGEPKLNHQNDRVWSDSQPPEFREHRRIRQKAMAWSGINYNLGVLPVYWIESTLNAFLYVELLDSEILPYLRNITSPEELKSYYIFQQDGAPAHVTWPSVVMLYQNFDNIISKNSDIPWPPYSPDLNPCDYYLWGRAKEDYLSSRNIQDHKIAFENKMA